MAHKTDSQSRNGAPPWKEVVATFQQPSTPRALWQLVNSLGLHLLIWYLIYLSLGVSWWLVLLLAILAGATLIRVFIIFHDCGHGAVGGGGSAAVAGETLNMIACRPFVSCV
jgi:omega-6 fatty acid desaturase (delta-12 desaturase)